MAADIAQHTMLSAHRRWSEIDNPSVWARTVASRKLARHLAGVEVYTDDPIPERQNCLIPESVDVEEWERRHELLRILDHLTPRQRQITAWNVDGYTAAEIASEMHIAFPEAQADLMAARRTFATYLGTSTAPTTSDDGPQDDGLDLRLAYQHHTLVIDAVGTLEVEAGLREVLVLTHPASPLTQPQVTVTAPRPEPDTILATFLRAAASWGPHMRLATRAHPVFTLAHGHDRAQALVGVTGSAHDLASDLHRELERAVHRVLDRALGLDLDLTRALDLDLDRHLDQARTVARELDRKLDHVRDLARDLAAELARVRDAGSLPARVLDDAIDLDLALEGRLGQAGEHYSRLGVRSLAQHLDRVRALIRDLDHVHASAGHLTRTTRALGQFHDALSDVTNLDLRTVDLVGVPLTGLRWSSSTQWPPVLETQIWRDSAPIGDGVFEVGQQHLPARGFARRRVDS